MNANKAVGRSFTAAPQPPHTMTVSPPTGTGTTVGGAAGYQWRSVNVTPPDQAAVDDLRIRFTVTAQGTSSGNVFAAYFELVTTAG